MVCAIWLDPPDLQLDQSRLVPLTVLYGVKAAGCETAKGRSGKPRDIQINYDVSIRLRRSSGATVVSYVKLGSSAVWC